MNHEFCSICGTLLNPYATDCAACGFEGDIDYDQYLSVDDDIPSELNDMFNSEEGFDQESNSEDPSYPV